MCLLVRSFNSDIFHIFLYRCFLNIYKDDVLITGILVRERVIIYNTIIWLQTLQVLQMGLICDNGISEILFKKDSLYSVYLAGKDNLKNKIFKEQTNFSAIKQKGESQNGCYKKTEPAKFFEKQTFFTR